MTRAYLCQRCSNKRTEITERITGYIHKDERCDSCRRLTKTATVVPVGLHDDVIDYDDMLDNFDAELMRAIQ